MTLIIVILVFMSMLVNNFASNFIKYTLYKPSLRINNLALQDLFKPSLRSGYLIELNNF